MTVNSAPPVNAADPSEPTGERAGRDYVVRSEEQLRVATEQVTAGYARPEKFVVTETKTITVQVSHEEVRLVQRAVADQSPTTGTLTGSASTADTDRWMVLRREEVVVTKQVVPVERVRLEVYPVTEQRQVTEQVCKEQIDTVPETTWTSGQNSTGRP